jgi:hypothetical protein
LDQYAIWCHPTEPLSWDTGQCLIKPYCIPSKE